MRSRPACMFAMLMLVTYIPAISLWLPKVVLGK
jgi:TRAP-type C4-dicarboxylate transport system permease large subunit